jgi:diketogulonate reductase-like aldo/keto reductase
MHLARAKTIRTTELPSGEAVPVLGQGTWHLAEGKHSREQEIRALQTGMDLGMDLIDTAEMYANGGAEELVGEAIAGRRDQVLLVSKVLPVHASEEGTVRACEESLGRLNTDWIDIYLLHWPGSIPLSETIAGFQKLIKAGKIRYWGVSNFDLDDLKKLSSVEGGSQFSTDQVLYNLTRRGIEFDLLPWCHRHRIPVMAYSPIEQGRLLNNPALRRVAKGHGATPAQVALAWMLQHDRVIAIPQAGVAEHVRENHRALEVHLTKADLVQLDLAFPPANAPRPLEML